MTRRAMTNAIKVLFAILLSLSTIGCDREQNAPVTHGPEPIDAGDECHLCGMIITNFPGPKGEAVIGKQHTLKFCSTRDLFAYLLQPESAAVVKEVYVHDMAATNWDTPADEAMVDAHDAWYVIGQPLKGAMGPTLASFLHQKDAQAFAARYGGTLSRFDEITLDIITNLGNPKAP